MRRAAAVCGEVTTRCWQRRDARKKAKAGTAQFFVGLVGGSRLQQHAVLRVGAGRRVEREGGEMAVQPAARAHLRASEGVIARVRSVLVAEKSGERLLRDLNAARRRSDDERNEEREGCGGNGAVPVQTSPRAIHECDAAHTQVRPCNVHSGGEPPQRVAKQRVPVTTARMRCIVATQRCSERVTHAHAEKPVAAPTSHTTQSDMKKRLPTCAHELSVSVEVAHAHAAGNHAKRRNTRRWATRGLVRRTMMSGERKSGTNSIRESEWVRMYAPSSATHQSLRAGRAGVDRARRRRWCRSRAAAGTRAGQVPGATQGAHRWQ